MAKIISMLDRVTALLKRYPEYGSNKYRLIAHVIWEDTPKSLKTPETKELLKLLAQGGLPAMETISRAWRLALEINPDFRTEDHEKTRRKQESETKEQLRMLGGLEKL